MRKRDRIPKMTIATPGNWFEIPLPSSLTDAEIDERVRQRAGAFPGLDEAVLRRSIEAAAVACREIGTIWAAMMLADFDGHVLIATIAVSVTDAGRWVTGPANADDIARALSKGADDGTWDIMTGSIPAGFVARVCHLAGADGNGAAGAGSLNLTYYLPLPDTSRVVTLSFVSPNTDIYEALVRQFDAMALTLTVTP